MKLSDRLCVAVGLALLGWGVARLAVCCSNPYGSDDHPASKNTRALAWRYADVLDMRAEWAWASCGIAAGAAVASFGLTSQRRQTSA